MKNTNTCFLFLMILFGFAFQSCKKETEIINEKKTDTAIIKSDFTEIDSGEQYEESDEDPTYNFPKTGNKASDFLIEPDVFEIQYETEGDLNNDGLRDIVFVRKDKKSKMASRSLLVLLQNKDKSYRLDKVSNTVMPDEYTESGYKIYDTETISIEKGELNIDLYGTGPTGNLFSTFKYSGNQLLLTHIETYNMGAGSHQSLNYDLVKGVLKQEIINTMEEEMPSEEKIFHLKKEKHEFENSSPDQIIQDAYKVIDSR
ncbi:hypothetical protein [Chryseobacterium sp. FH1]|uniref:hypothetical protein n=1 Tax=Chryseobacterium sp. FH1 TaxID=1233951 RepID=UPI0004E38AC0|nr:hypothetical protein [Chryseobacterium sp. FH1]KFC18486.1 hypothetical protein IO90_18460 [Chryseobacterium sp. FH1]